MMRTANGLVACTAVMYTASGPVSGGGNLTASVSPDQADGSIYRKTPGTVTTGTVAASGSGGATPYSYAWQVDDATWKATASMSGTTAFQSPVLAAGDSASTMARCVVTDANGLTSTTPDVVVTASNNYEAN